MSTPARKLPPLPPGHEWRNGMRVKVAPKPAPARVPTVQAPSPRLTPTKAPVPSQSEMKCDGAEHQAPELGQTEGDAPATTPATKEPRPHPLRDQAPLPVPRFAFVWGVGEGAPRRRHETVEGARGEARRLAELHPGATFLVYVAELVPDPRDTEGAPDDWMGRDSDAVLVAAAGNAGV